MKILHTVSGIWKSTGGPAEVIPLLCRYLLAQDADVSIATLDGEFSDATIASKAAGVKLHSFPIRFRCKPWYSKSIRHGLHELIKEADIIHNNGMWEYINWCAGSETIKQKKPYIMSFHGSIMHADENWSLRHKLVWKLLDGRYVQRACCLHACTREELKFIRQVGLSNPVAVIPNGVEIWEPLPTAACYKLVPEFKNHKTVLFLSRVHPGKGVYDLVNAWCLLENFPKDWQLIIAGPGEPKHVEKLKNLIDSNKAKSNITYMGPLFGEKRKAAYQACDVFVLPSHTENFGVVIGEALACGKPVIASREAPWPELIEYQCGWWIPNGVSTLVNALREAMEASDEQRSAMGQRGRELITKKYSWPYVAKQMVTTYEWVIGGGQTPSWVETV